MWFNLYTVKNVNLKIKHLLAYSLSVDFDLKPKDGLNPEQFVIPKLKICAYCNCCVWITKPSILPHGKKKL